MGITLAGSYDVVVQQSVTVAHLTLGGVGSHPRLVIQANPTNGDATLIVTQRLHSQSTIVLSSIAAKSFYDAELVLDGARFVSDSGAVLKIAAGTPGQGKRLIRLNAGSVWENGGHIEVLEYDAELAFADTSAKLINHGAIVVDSTRTLSLRNGVFDLSTGTIDGPIHMASMGLDGGNLSSTGHLIFLGTSNTIDGDVENHGILEIRADDQSGDATLTVERTLRNPGILRLSSTSARSYYDAMLDVRADSLVNESSGRMASLPGTFSAGGRILRLRSGVHFVNRGRLQVTYPLEISMADTTAGFANFGRVDIDTSATLSLKRGTFRPHDGWIRGPMALSSSRIQAGKLSDSVRVTLEAGNVIAGQLENYGHMIFHGTNTVAAVLVNQASGRMVVEAATQSGDAVLKIESELQNHGRLALSSQSDRTFYDARIEVKSGRLQNFTSGVLEAQPGTFGVATRELQLDRGTSFENSGTVQVQQYDFSIGMADTSARVSNSGIIRVDSTKTLSMDGGRLHLLSGRIEGAIQMTDMRIGPGTLSANGRLVFSGFNNGVDAPVTNQGVFELQAQSSTGDARLTLTADLENSGRMELTSSSDRGFHDAILRVEKGKFHNAASGVLSALPGTFAAGERRIELMDGGQLSQEGRWEIRQPLLLNQPDAAATINRGALVIASGQRMTVAAGTLENTGILSGSGTLDVTGAELVNSGILQPGTSPGRLTIDGDLRQPPTGTLAIEIGGLDPGTGHDVLDVTGAVDLDGTLQVQWFGGFFPADADSFRVLNYGSRRGTFAQITGGNLGGGQQLSPQYQADHLTLVYQHTGNRAPVAGNDAATTAEDEPVLIPILRNDADPDGDPFQLAALDTGQTVGSVRLNAGDTTVTYTPPPDFNGEDRFEYRIADVYGLQARATVTITVTPVNDPPRIHSTPPAVAYVNSVYEYPVSAVDVDGDALTYTLISGPAWLGFSTGSSVLRGTPGAGDVGEANVTIEVRDSHGAAAQQSFTLTVVQRSDLANLTVSQVQAPAQVFSGESIEIRWTVTNNGNQSTDAPRWSDRVYFSDDTVWDARTDRLIVSKLNPTFLLPGDSYTNRATFTVPLGASGPHTIFVVTDAEDELIEGEETDNRTAATVQVTLSPMPDLRVTAVQAPPNAFSGDTIEVAWTVENVGNGPTLVDAWYDGFFLSSDSVLDYSLIRANRIRFEDHFLDQRKHTGILQPGESYQATARIALPHYQFGSMHLFVFTDTRANPRGAERGDVFEHTNEFNNAAAAIIDITLTPPPDLVVTSVLHADNGRSGEPLYVEWTVENQGARRAMESQWTDRIFLSSSPAFHPDSVRILGDLFHRGGLETGDGYQASRQVYLPEGIAGPFYIFVQTDADEEVFEYV
ncbi:MAG: CARDB domain-containing protein [candidate division KSB1 bacterium]|nr:CARDB domain-containing protein [candidate division KSB1 bacterium]